MSELRLEIYKIAFKLIFTIIQSSFNNERLEIDRRRACFIKSDTSTNKFMLTLQLKSY